MKKYLTIAAVLGVIAFASVSFLAQADQQPTGAADNVAASENAAPADAADGASTADPSDGEAAADQAESTQSDSKAEKFAADDQTCATDASTPNRNGSSPSDVQKNRAYRKCMQMKGHSAAEMKAAGVDLKNPTGKNDSAKAGGASAAPDANDQGAPAEE